MKRRVVLIAIGILFGATLVFGIVALPALGLPRNESASAGADVNGSYTGSVRLDGAYAGTLNDNITPETLDLGQIDLALDLAEADGAVTGYVVLSDTLVFTREHTIMVTPVAPPPGPGTPTPAPYPLDIGPQVQGSFDGTTLRLRSEEFSGTVSGREVTRRFRLVSSGVQDDGATLEGVYKETLWGYAPEPSTVVGTFRLRRPVYGSEEGDYNTYLPLVLKAAN